MVAFKKTILGIKIETLVVPIKRTRANIFSLYYFVMIRCVNRLFEVALALKNNRCNKIMEPRNCASH